MILIRVLNAVFWFTCAFTLCSCSGLMQSLEEENREANREGRRGDFYSGKRSLASTSNRRSANSMDAYNTRNMKRRHYRPLQYSQQEVEGRTDEYGNRISSRRRTRKDFIDSSGGSLWNSQGQTNYLFVQNKRFDAGDLVVITIDRALRREIQYALWKSLPRSMRKIRKKRKPSSLEKNVDGDKSKLAAGVDKVNTAADQADNALGGAKKNSLDLGGDDDLIRMEVIQNLGNGLIRLSGQRRLVYRGRPQFVEVSGLIRGNKIDNQARANSMDFLDSRARVLQ